MIARLQPNRVRRTYLGGGRIDAFTGGPRFSATCAETAVPHADATERIPPMPRPEDWLASTTTAFNGTFEIEGEGLGRLEDGRLVKDVVGELPILVKLLDSDERLVIQAHPTVPCAKRLFDSPVGKTECWYFLPGTAEDACVYLGFKPGITREKWEESVRAGMDGVRPLLSFLHRIPVAPGDFVFVDGGMPHAIGGGCFMVELQEPSDLMVVAERFTPSGRRIPDAKMHGGVGCERMFDVYEYEGLSFKDVCRRYVRRGLSHKEELFTNDNCHNCSQIANTNLCASASLREAYCICGPELTDKFAMWRVMGGGSVVLPRDCAVAVVTGGNGEVNGLPAKKGDRLLIADDCRIDVSGDLALIVCACPVTIQS
ncbi:MAG: class I mannose-6-phosphate isomerase [Kiritimatiellae bacterium]|nr:class I mannose-6-phosphate isomerase [Kiritimatiellia bacterium]